MTVNTEVTAADIARIAGVGRAAVSNWRRRHPDFPAPVGGPPNSPTFALTDVEAWLDANGRTADVNIERRPRTRAVESVNSALAEPMAALLPGLTSGVVLDPGSGDGSLLSAAAERLGPELRYADASLDDDVSDGFRHAADAVISIVPATERSIDGITWEYGQPTRNDYPLAWVQICLSYVKLGGVAVVAVPFATAVRASGRRIRAELLRAGVLTHVIGLPEKIGGATTPWQIWILGKPTGRSSYVLRMADLTDDVPEDAESWERVFADPDRTRDIPSIELLDEDVLLVPAAHMTAGMRDVAPDYAKLRRRYEVSVSRLTGVAPLFKPGDGEPVGPLVTVADLVRSGALTFISRDDAEVGDVVVPSGHGGFDAYVLDGQTTDETRVQSVIRCNPETIDPHFLTCFLRSETNRRQASGTTSGTFRLDVRRARVPRMPLAEQRRYGDAFRRLMAYADSATEVATTAADATRTAIYGLTSGVFEPEAR